MEVAYRLMSEMEETHWWYRARREILAGVVARYFRKGAALLDYGCGAGGTAARLARDGFAVSVFDAHPDARTACLRRGLSVLENDDIDAAEFDGVLLGDVLEHVEDDRALLVRLASRLRSGGRMLVAVPAYEFLWSGEDVVSHHLRRYAPGGFRRLLTSAGLRPVLFSHFNTLLSPLAVGAIFADRAFRPRGEARSNVRPLPGSIDAALGTVFGWEERLIGRVPLPFGISLIAVAERDGGGR